MIDPYRMVFVNVIALIFVLSVLAIWKYKLNKKINPVLIVIIFSILPIISVFRKGVYESGDFNLQIYRAIDFYNSISHGILLPRWGSELNATYGHPVFIFVSNLQFYLMSLFHAFGFSFVASAKIILILFFILSGLTMFYFVKNNFGKKAALVSSIFYLYTPYHLVDLHFRASFGDIIAFAIFPLSFLFAINLLEKINLKNFILLSLTVFILVIAHPITMTAIIYLTVFIFFISFIKYKNIKNLATTLLSILFGGILSSFYWIPLIAESKYTYDGVFVNTVILQDFKDLLYSTWRFGFLYQGPNGELSFLLGYAHLILIIFSIFVLITAKKINFELKIIAFLLTSTFFILFLITKYSEPLWNVIPLLESIQFSYRLLFIVTFTTSLIAGLIAQKIKPNVLIGVICLFAIAVTILNWGNRRTIAEINDNYLINNVPYSTFQGEGNPPEQPIWRKINDPWMKVIPKHKLEKEKEENNIIIKEIYNSPNKSIFLVNNSTTTTLRRNIFYFPGWNAYDNGNQIKIYYKKDGIIHVKLTPGLHKLEIIFENSDEIKIANFISLLGFFTLFILIMYIIIKYLKRID